VNGEGHKNIKKNVLVLTTKSGEKGKWGLTGKGVKQGGEEFFRNRRGGLVVGSTLKTVMVWGDGRTHGLKKKSEHGTRKFKKARHKFQKWNGEGKQKRKRETDSVKKSTQGGETRQKKGEGPLGQWGRRLKGETERFKETEKKKNPKKTLGTEKLASKTGVTYIPENHCAPKP